MAQAVMAKPVIPLGKVRRCRATVGWSYTFKRETNKPGRPPELVPVTFA